MMPGSAPRSRLGHLEPTRYDAAQRAFARKAVAALEPRVEAEGFSIETRDGCLIGPFNPLLRSPRMGSAFLDFQALETKASSLDARLRQIVILAVGGVTGAAYIPYSHNAAAEQAGVSATAIDSLSRGELPPALEERDRVCTEFTFALLRSGGLDDTLFKRGVEVLGARAMVDVIVLADSYRMLADLLNVFDEGAPG